MDSAYEKEMNIESMRKTLWGCMKKEKSQSIVFRMKPGFDGLERIAGKILANRILLFPKQP